MLGDLFFSEKLIYALIPVKGDKLQVAAAGYAIDEEALRKFCTDIEESIKTYFDGRRVRGMDFNWKSQSLHISKHIRPRYSHFESESERVIGELKSTDPVYDPEDIEASKILVDTEVRQFILKLAQVGKMRSKDASEITKPEILQNLLSLKIASEEFLLTCKQDQHTICVVPVKDHLTKEPMTSLRCSVCGRSFPDENLQVIYTLTNTGKRLIDGSLWMSIWITELLKVNGVKIETIKWGLEANGEELDIIVQDFDSRIFFELKDREFGLGDAYPFVYRVTRYGGSVAIIATLDKVSPDAQKFFKEETQRREYPLPIRYFEGSEGIRQGIIKLVEDMSFSQVRRLVHPFTLRIGFDLWPVIEKWIIMSKKKISATSDNTAQTTSVETL